MIVKLLTEHHLEFLSLKGGCTGLSVSTLVKMFEISCTGSYIETTVFIGLKCSIVITWSYSHEKLLSFWLSKK